jgi:hypothetical protein
MRQIIRIDGAAQLRLGLTRNVPVARITAATLSLQRAGAATPPTVLQASAITEDWYALFDIPDVWMAEQPAGRYTATLTSACGVVTFEIQKGRAPRLGAQYVLGGVCGDVGAVCVDECPGGVLTFTPLGTELLEPLLTEDGFVLVR